MLNTSLDIPLLTTFPNPDLHSVYAVHLDRGDSVDNSSTIVGITHDRDQAYAYVAHQEAVLARILHKYKDLAPALDAWIAANPLSHQLPGQSYEDYYHVHGKWTVAFASYKRDWLTAHLTLEELTMDSTRDNNSWCVSLLRWLPDTKL